MGAASIPRPIGGFMKPAHISNWEFVLKCQEFEGKVMTLFIDNIRLYNRPIKVNKGSDTDWVNYLQATNDLLALCTHFSKNKFVIFCSHEDTPIDEHIKVPPNVLGIYAVNSAYNNDIIHPFPYGLQRELGENDNRVKIMQEEICVEIEPTKLLYINCGLGKERNQGERAYLPYFESQSWATCRFDKDSKFFPYEKYRDFLDEIRQHKFMVCPQGHGMDCHRNWESLYMRRVPVMKEHPYFRRLMEGFPVLFVDDWPQITEELLIASEPLYEEAQKMDLDKLDLTKIYGNIIRQYK